ncbi:hypothetical protein CMMCAS05_03235 [Clavibacter michiganensis subsp. michiganensis]|nr:hypothetical protein CMMCAS05_03235 [Clavibacter michiganensis subsp. michiganensis]
MTARVPEAGQPRIRPDDRQVVGQVRAEAAVGAHRVRLHEEGEEPHGLRGELLQHGHAQRRVEAHALSAGSDEHSARRRRLHDARGLQRPVAGSDRAHVVAVVDLVPDAVRHARGDEDDAAARQHGQLDAEGPRHLARPRSRRDQHVVRGDVARARPHAAERAVRVEQRPDDLDPGAHDRARPPGRGGERLGRDGGLHLRVLGVVHGRGDRGVQPRLELERPTPVDGHGVDARGALGGGEGEERIRALVGGRDDEPALGLVLDGGQRVAQLVRELGGHLGPTAGGQLRELELGARPLVGHEDVALALGARAGRDGGALDDRDAHPRTGERPGARGPDDAAAHDDHVTRHGVPALTGGCASGRRVAYGGDSNMSHIAA